MKFTCRVCGGYMMSAPDDIRCGACGRKLRLSTGEAEVELKSREAGIIDWIIDPAAEVNHRRLQENVASAEKNVDMIDLLDQVSVRDGKSAKYLSNFGEEKGQNG